MILPSFLRDLRYAARQHNKARGLAAAAVITLALGIGVNTAIFSIIEAVLIRPLPYHDPQQLVVVWQTDQLHRDSGAYFSSYREFEVFQKQSHSFESLAALTWATGPESMLWKGRPVDLLALPASVNFFSMLGQPAAIGRTFAQSDLNSQCTLVLSYRFWQQKLGAPAGIIGQTVNLGKSTCNIIGVMPKNFEFYPIATDAWSLITPASEFARKPWQSMTGAFGRLKPGVSRAAAEAELTALQSEVVQEAPANLSMMRTWTPDVLSLQSNFTWLAGRNLRRGLQLLLAASGLILAIAAVNVGGLLLGRAVTRSRDVAVRSALGSSRARLISLSIAESALIGAGGAVIGVMLAEGLVAWFRSVNPVELPPGATITVDARVLLFAVVSSVVACVLFAMLPTWYRSRLSVNELLKSGGTNLSHSASGARTAQVLVVVQVALSMVLLVGAGLLSISLWKLTETNFGYRTDHLFTATIHLPDVRYADTIARNRFADQFTAALRTTPGVESVAIGSDYVPRGLNLLSVQGRTAADHPSADVAIQDLSPSGFVTLQIPILRGRAFDARDEKDTQSVAIINEALARQYFPNSDPLGHAIKLSRAEDPREPWLTIVGVVGNVKTNSVFQEMGYIEPPAVYRPLAQDAPSSLTVMIAGQNGSSRINRIQHQLSSIDPTLVLSGVDALNAARASQLSQPRFRAALLGGFAALALLLSLVGLYGTLSQLVARRTREISIRMALGADRDRILKSVLRQACAITSAGILVGGVIAALGLRVAYGLIYGIHADGAAEFAGAAAVLLLLTIAVAAAPALRASSIDPVRALRDE